MSLIHDIIAFLQAKGIVVRFDQVPEPSCLPGIGLQEGALVIDESRLLYPGDILHEAGHLAVLSAEERSKATGAVGDDGGMEMAAIAWSWAAAVYLRIEPSVLFHTSGYKGGSAALIENFSAGRYIGVPMLEWLGMTVGPKRAQAEGVAPYPEMIRWVREELSEGATSCSPP